MSKTATEINAEKIEAIILAHGVLVRPISGAQARTISRAIVEACWELQQQAQNPSEGAGRAPRYIVTPLPWQSRRRRPMETPVDRSQTQLSGGGEITPDHREIKPESGQQKGYVVLTAEERAKGFVRPVRRTYIHTSCGTETRMSQDIAETYARDPGFYNGTFCVGCRAHFPLDQFVWKDNPDQQVGS